MIEVPQEVKDKALAMGIDPANIVAEEIKPQPAKVLRIKDWQNLLPQPGQEIIITSRMNDGRPRSFVFVVTELKSRGRLYLKLKGVE